MDINIESVKYLLETSFLYQVNENYKYYLNDGYKVREWLEEEDVKEFIKDVAKGYHLTVYVDDVEKKLYPCIR